MSLAPGARLGPYEITGSLGVGGMGEVYRARDTRLKRHVALKILPAEFAADPERLGRFQREAEVLASLNHPNIAAIHGLEESGGIRALVLELVEGQTLAARIVQGPISVDDALSIARQVAEAVSAAHEHGVIHRDLKPANITLRPDGVVKVLDFGLAKLTEADGTGEAGADLSQYPTLSQAPTRLGVIMGTAAYMSPEQARGKPSDKRADIWAFGCVLYEMLTGTRAFGGEDLSDTLATVLKGEPDWGALPADTPRAIHRLLRRCLVKDRTNRLPDIAVARLDINDALAETPDATAGITPRRVSRWRVVSAVAIASLASGILASTVVWMVTRPTPSRVTRTTISPPAGAPLTITGTSRDLAVAPGGTHVVYVGANGTRLVVRALDQLQPTVLTGVGAPSHPVFSPDGQWIAFFNGNTSLEKVATAGGPAVRVSPLTGSPRGASWGPDDRIVFATLDNSTGLLRVSANGGEPEALTTPDRAQGEVDHLWPELLPGGEAVLFTITMQGGIEQAQVAALDLRTGERRTVLRGGSHAQYVAPGYLVYGVAGTLRAVGFDLGRLETIGAPVPVIEGIAMTSQGGTDVSVADDGTLVYVRGQGEVQRTLVWVDRQGQEELLPAPPGVYSIPRLSPDGTKMAVIVNTGQEADISIWDLTRQTLTRVTFGGGLNNPVWTPDGQRLVWGSGALFWQAADGTGAVERLAESDTSGLVPYAVTPDGTRLILRADGPGTGADLMVLALNGNRTITPLIQTTFNERNAEISPDGRWLAYESDESGQSEVYVRPFPAVNAGRWQVSTAGGRQPLWAGSGREIFHRALDGALLGVSAEVVGERGFRVGTPTTLLEGRYYTGGPFSGRMYAASPDGRRFVMIKESSGADEGALPPTIVVVQHWTEELQRLVPD